MKKTDNFQVEYEKNIRHGVVVMTPKKNKTK